MSATFGWFNRRYLRMPHSIGLLVMGLMASVLLILVDLAFPAQHLYGDLTRTLRRIDFTALVMDGMLAFLLFAGAINLDLRAIRARAWPIASLALIGTLISTALVGGCLWLAAGWLGMPMTLSWAMVFGALISPTDPVAVLTMLKNVDVPDILQAEMQGEALFNDGVGVVVFTLMVSIASSGSAAVPPGVAEVMWHVLLEVGGGLVLGAATGYVAYRALRSIDDFAVEVLITLALVAGTYGLTQALGASGPLAVVAAGLLVGHRAPQDAMSDHTQGYVTALWTLIDEVLNSILFLLIGLEVLVLSFDLGVVWLALAAVPIVLVGRLAAVSAPLLLRRWAVMGSISNVPFLTWAGVRGGISVALALSLPETEAKSVLLAATYGVVVFSIVVQGSTLGLVARHTVKADGR
nr:sodium:proton antiporter [Neoroseomonas terrae]